MQPLNETINNMSAMVTGLEMKIEQLKTLRKYRFTKCNEPLEMGYRAAGAVADIAKVLEKEAKIARVGFRAAMACVSLPKF
jgi:hypothetical protein